MKSPLTEVWAPALSLPICKQFCSKHMAQHFLEVERSALTCERFFFHGVQTATCAPYHLPSHVLPPPISSPDLLQATWLPSLSGPGTNPQVPNAFVVLVAIWNYKSLRRKSQNQAKWLKGLSRSLLFQ